MCEIRVTHITEAPWVSKKCSHHKSLTSRVKLILFLLSAKHRNIVLYL